MPRARFSAYISSITNRGPQSGGSTGGDKKAGLVNFSFYSQIPSSLLASRTFSDCCKDPTRVPNTSNTSNTSNINDPNNNQNNPSNNDQDSFDGSS